MNDNFNTNPNYNLNKYFKKMDGEFNNYYDVKSVEPVNVEEPIHNSQVGHNEYVNEYNTEIYIQTDPDSLAENELYQDANSHISAISDISSGLCGTIYGSTQKFSGTTGNVESTISDDASCAANYGPMQVDNHESTPTANYGPVSSDNYGYVAADSINNSASFRNTSENHFNNVPNYKSVTEVNLNLDQEPIDLTKRSSVLRKSIEENVLAQSFIFMTFALIVTIIASTITLNSDNLMVTILSNRAFFYGLIISELVVVFLASTAMKSNNLIASAILFVAYSGLNGVTLSILYFVYTFSSITSIFGMSAVIFAITGTYGIITKKDLSTLGNICIMALIALIVFSVTNLFIFKNTGFDLILNAAGVLIFVGLAAYDSQKIKRMSAISNSDNISTLALYGALTLYLDFINLFLRLLRIFGKRK